MTPTLARRKARGSTVENIWRVVKRTRKGKRKRPSQPKTGDGGRAL